MTLTSLLAILRRRWRVVGLVAGLALVLGLVASLSVAPKYSASATLVVSPMPDQRGGGVGEVNIRTEREVLRSREVARRAARTLGVDLTASSDLLTATDVAAPSGSQVLEVTVTALSGREAAASADALAQAYLAFRGEGAASGAQRYIAVIDRQIADLEAQEPLTESASTRVAALAKERQTLELVGSDPGRIIGYATVPTGPSSPPQYVFVLAGLVGGMLAGCFAALVRERTDRLVRSPDRLRAVTSEDVIVAEGPDDTAAWDWLALGIAAALPAPEDTTVVALLTPGVESVSVLGHLEGRLAAGADGDGEAADDRAAGALVLVDLAGAPAPARLATVLGRAAVVALVVSPRTPLAAVARTRTMVRSYSEATLLTVFLRPPRRASRPARPIVTAPPAPVPPAARDAVEHGDGSEPPTGGVPGKADAPGSEDAPGTAGAPGGADASSTDESKSHGREAPSEPPEARLERAR